MNFLQPLTGHRIWFNVPSHCTIRGLDYSRANNVNTVFYQGQQNTCMAKKVSVLRKGNVHIRIAR